MIGVPDQNIFGFWEQQHSSPGTLVNLSVAHDLVRMIDWIASISYGFLQTMNLRLHEADLQDQALLLSSWWNVGHGAKKPTVGLGASFDQLLVDNRSMLASREILLDSPQEFSLTAMTPASTTAPAPFVDPHEGFLVRCGSKFPMRRAIEGQGP